MPKVDNDRELLELAAKAAGYRIDGLFSAKNPDDMLILNERGEQSVWNPLAYDGDALRLAVKLSLAVIPFPIYSEYKTGATAKLYRNSAAVYRGRAENIEFDEEYGSDPAAATRRAIVRAAAEIGKQMEEGK